MAAPEAKEVSPIQLRKEQIDHYWAGDLTRRVYLYRRQRKAILENCRRIAVVGVGSDTNDPSFVSVERLLGMGLEIIPVCQDRESLLGLRCYKRLGDVPGKLDIVQVYPRQGIDYEELARESVIKGVHTFWLESGLAASREVEDILINGRVHLVEYESLETEYLKRHAVHNRSGSSAAEGSESGESKRTDEQKSRHGETWGWTQRRDLEDGARSLPPSARRG